jgi:glycosyltransferase involved in cell wall biosynthesis
MIHYSVIMPQRNAADEVERRLGELCGVLAALGKPYEIVCVDDGSSPSHRKKLKELIDAFPGLRLLFLDSCAGVSAALTAGIAAARGEAIIVLEAGDLYPAKEVAKLIRRLSRADAVFGCRRLSPARRAFRRLAQAPRRLLFGDAIRDPDCMLWAARREAVTGLVLARGMYRYLPGMISRRGFRVGELHVDHQPAARRTATRDAWPNPGDLLAAWWLRQRQTPYTATEIRPTDEAADGRRMRIDPPQPFSRGEPSRPDGQHDDHRNAAP